MPSIRLLPLSLALLMLFAASLSGCGQKGPLIVEQVEPVQEEEAEPTK